MNAIDWGTPTGLFGAVLRYAGRPLAWRSGRGRNRKSGTAIASRGVEVTALEPDAQMADLLARITLSSHRGGSTIWCMPRRLALDRPEQVAKVVELLVRQGGVVALFGRPAD